MTAINTKRDGDSGYIAIFKRKQIELYATTMLAAHRLAVQHFKPSRRDIGYLSVMLAERDTGEAVTHTPAD